ncbi:hypothetical protein Pst134EA_029477 [Puccinia striiformis f. sp. tritici]|uniref:hypothetical protein n=1 Tax=Puccinia striiformis f. sp. tritici TaxID=168172 RepID=UPI0020073E54|nr:hypothetical protein Pst134EA_029477 [Puccinia striiformis f. sp. tritici]KAH9447439.1 hypothetical protein Pst134EA_029477 [Puccinia striiformis f. sp. tritici]
MHLCGQFISAIVLLQYMKFFSQQVSRESRVAVRLGTIGISLHLGQVVVELWGIFQSLQYYESRKPYEYFLWEALQIGLGVGVIFVVQLHFFRLAYATNALSTKWSIPLGLICLGACVGGLGTAFGL